MNPRVFISYSWTSEAHRARVRNLAEHLVSKGVDVVIDIWDLKPGHDASVFMEKMVTLKKIQNIIVISDRLYAEKADARRGGVGIEAQILSLELYGRVDQTKVIPVVTESFTEDTPSLPLFLRNRFFIDFRGDREQTGREELIRAIYDAPKYRKPKGGSPPDYVQSTTTSPSFPERKEELAASDGRIIPLTSHGRCLRCGNLMPAPHRKGDYQQCDMCGMSSEID